MSYIVLRIEQANALATCLKSYGSLPKNPKETVKLSIKVLLCTKFSDPTNTNATPALEERRCDEACGCNCAAHKAGTNGK